MNTPEEDEQEVSAVGRMTGTLDEYEVSEPDAEDDD